MKLAKSLTAACFAFVLVSALGAKTERITILHLNDTHGRIEPVTAKDGHTYGGFARVSYLVDSLRTDAGERGATLYFLHAGDALQGPPLSNLTKGALDFLLLNRMGVYAMAVGNHEFDFGQANLAELHGTGQAKFPLVSANVVDSLGNTLFSAGRAGKILVLGLTTQATPIGTHPDNVKGLRFLDPDSTAAEVLADWNTDEGPVVALTHLGWCADSTLAANVPEIDVVVGGHSHSVFEEPKKVGSTLIVQAGAWGVYLGKLDLEVKKGKIKDWQYELILVSDSVPEDAEMAAFIASQAKKVDEELAVPLGKTEVALVQGWTDAEGERSIGDMLAEIMKEATGADFAFTNAGGVRAAINPGDVTMKDVLTALPFGNTVVVMELTGAQVQQVLDLDASYGRQAGGSLHLAGVTYDVQDGKAADIRIGGVTLDESRTYKIATNDFLAAGGDGYEMLKSGSDIYDTGTILNVLFSEYIKKAGVVTAP